jgi:hypothetical protein
MAIGQILAGTILKKLEFNRTTIFCSVVFERRWSDSARLDVVYLTNQSARSRATPKPTLVKDFLTAARGLKAVASVVPATTTNNIKNALSFSRQSPSAHGGNPPPTPRDYRPYRVGRNRLLEMFRSAGLFVTVLAAAAIAAGHGGVEFISRRVDCGGSCAYRIFEFGLR